ncbi:MAG: phosphotransferase [Sphaerobacteraceae bacterium]|nr:MAG: phosphotransferase [Sphaerobacteraceae bacterium]
MKSLPFDMPGRFFRGNIHMHSNRSDGALSVDDTVAMYRDNGYDFISLTDHFLEKFDYPITDTRQYRTADFTTLIGAELHAPALENGTIWHLVGVGLPDDFAPPADGETGPGIAKRAWDTGAFVGMAHPSWYSMTMNDMRSVQHAHAIEVFNQASHVSGERGDSWQITDQVLAEGRRLSTYGTDDSHLRDNLPDKFGAWTMVKATDLEPEALTDSLKAGHYYSSQGPLIHHIALNSDNSAIEISCSPASAVKVLGKGPLYTYEHGAGLSQSTLSIEHISSKSPFCRVVVVDAAGKRAWSNPIWFD